MKKTLLEKKRTVKLITGSNYYSRQETIPVLGALPSKEVKYIGEPGEKVSCSKWGLLLNLTNEHIKQISTDSFSIFDYDCIIVDGAKLLRNIDYCEYEYEEEELKWAKVNPRVITSC